MSRSDAGPTIWGLFHVHKIREGEFCFWEPPLHEWKRAVELNLLRPDMPFPGKIDRMLRGAKQSVVLQKSLVLRVSVEDVLIEMEWLGLDQQPYHAILAAACVVERAERTPLGVLPQYVMRTLRSTFIVWDQAEPFVPNSLRIEDWRMRPGAAELGIKNFGELMQFMNPAIVFLVRYRDTVRELLPNFESEHPDQVQDLKRIFVTWESLPEEERQHLVIVMVPDGKRLALIAESAYNLKRVQKE